MNKKSLYKDAEKIRSRIINDIRNDEDRRVYFDKKEQYKKEYVKIINNDKNLLMIEKSRMKCKMYKGQLPHLSIFIAILIAVLVAMMQSNSNYLNYIISNEILRVIIPYIFTATVLLVIFLILESQISKGQFYLTTCYLRLEVLEELEEEIYIKNAKCNRGYRVKQKMK